MTENAQRVKKKTTSPNSNAFILPLNSIIFISIISISHFSQKPNFFKNPTFSKIQLSQGQIWQTNPQPSSKTKAERSSKKERNYSPYSSCRNESIQSKQIKCFWIWLHLLDDRIPFSGRWFMLCWLTKKRVWLLFFFFVAIFDFSISWLISGPAEQAKKNH